MIPFISEEDRSVRKSKRCVTVKRTHQLERTQRVDQAEVLPFLSNWPVNSGQRCQACPEHKRGAAISTVELSPVFFVEASPTSHTLSDFGNSRHRILFF